MTPREPTQACGTNKRTNGFNDWAGYTVLDVGMGSLPPYLPPSLHGGGYIHSRSCSGRVLCNLGPDLMPMIAREDGEGCPSCPM